MKVLGHLISDDSSPESCFQATLDAAWRAFFANCGKGLLGKGRRSVESRLRLLNRACLPIVLFRCPRWPFTTKRAQRLDRAQCQMLLKILAVPKHAGEDRQSYNSRCNAQTGLIIKKHGKWSEFWATYLLNWHDHLVRPSNSSSFAAQLFHIQDDSWLQSLRAPFVSLHRSIWGGRTETRALAEAPKRRWETSTDAAIDWLVKHGRNKEELRV